MNFFKEIIDNKILLIAAVSWLVAGIIKVIIEAIVNKKIDIKRVCGAGGMPSSHTATVVALCVSTGFICKVYSPEFAIAFIFMIIVIHDAVGVRLETGKQAKILNTMLFDIGMAKDVEIEKRLKEYVGHTPLQAFFGGIVGLIVSIIMLNLFNII